MPPKKNSSASVTGKAKARPKREIEKTHLPLTKSVCEIIRSKEVCGACLLPVDEGSQVGLIDSCNHFFHHECVERWSNTENTCPQCKLRFFWLGSYTPEGKRTSLERIKRRDQEGEEDEAFEDYTVCEKCKELGDEATLMLCDGMHGTCNAAYHCACVGLSCVPRGSWFCADCVERGFDVDANGRRGKRAVESTRSITPERKHRHVATEEQSGLTPEACANANSTSAAASTVSACSESRAESAPVSNRRSSSSLPPQLRLNSLACVTSPVDGPSFRVGGAPANQGSSPGVGAEARGQEIPKEGIFANFAARRRQRRGQSDASQGSSSVAFSLNPAYEDDYLGRTLK